MNKQNSAGNNHLPSKPAQGPIAPRADDCNQASLVGRVLPTAYAFECTEKFRETFSKDPSVPLPATYHLAIWNKDIGEPAWEKEVADTTAANQQAQEQHSREVADISATNEQIEESNRERKSNYETKLAAYEAAVAVNQRQDEEAQEKALKFAKDQLLRELKESVNSQSAAIDAAISHAEELVEKRFRASKTLIKILFALAVLTLPTLIGSAICCVLIYLIRKHQEKTYCLQLIKAINQYNIDDFNRGDLGPFKKDENRQGWMRFLMCYPTSSSLFYSKVISQDAFRTLLKTLSRTQFEEYPLGRYSPKDFTSPVLSIENTESAEDFIRGVVLSTAPLVGILYCISLCWPSLRKSSHANNPPWKTPAITRQRLKNLTTVLVFQLENPVNVSYLIEYGLKYIGRPENLPTTKPEQPIEKPLLPIPASPIPQIPTRLVPPPECFDTSTPGDYSHILKGSLVYTAEETNTLARYQIFAEDVMRPYYLFGGVPFSFNQGTSPHMLVVGTSGSGKTTTILHLLSSLLPLTRTQAVRITERSPDIYQRTPETSREWARSFTHQAVIYNAKGEYLNYLRAFGFDQDIDLFNLDPADPLCYAWDVATDINNRESIEQFVVQLIPQDAVAKQDKNLETWLGAARGAIEAVIVSFRNASLAANEKPSWTLRDVIRAFATENALRHVLHWHDMPQEEIEHYFEIADTQKSSIFVVVRESLKKFSLVANRWIDAQARGRILSLKDWALRGANSVLLLPNTMSNVKSYGPLNQTLFKALTSIILTDEYSKYLDEEGNKQPRQRYVVLDELGNAGHFDELERLMTEGRSFGVHVILGLHQLSQLTKTYGKEGANSVIGMCSFYAFLKNMDTETNDWMSKFLGNCLRAYQKESYAYGTSKGKTFTVTKNSTRGTSEGKTTSLTTGSTEGTAKMQGQSDSSSETTRGSDYTKNTGKSNNESLTTNYSENKAEATGTSSQENESKSTGESEANTDASNESHTDSLELRGEAAIEPHEFSQFPDLASTGILEGVYVAPTVPLWRVQLEGDTLNPNYEFPEKAHDENTRRSEEEDERVSRSVGWSQQDLERLFIDPSHMLPLPPKVILQGKEKQQLPPTPPKLLTRYQEPTPPATKAPLPEESASDEPPLADFP